MKSSRNKVLLISILFCAVFGIAYQNCGNISDQASLENTQSPNNESDLTDAATIVPINICKGEKCYKVGGKIGGLNGTLQLMNNSYLLNITATGTVGFTFPQNYAQGNPYNVVVTQQPAGQTCTVTSGAGTFPAANVSSVVVQCVTSGWSAMNTTGAPMARFEHGAAWTGSKMIIWGGVNGSTALNTGGIYNPAANTWTPMNTTGAPMARGQFITIWTGSKMIIWGGQTNAGQINTGGLYDPATDSWSAMNTTGAPSPRYWPSAIWTGSKMIIWGGSSGTALLSDGAAYDPATNSWSPISSSGAPSPRSGHVAVWTGSQMIVWGGENNSGAGLLNDGKIYTPSTNTWTGISASPLSGRALPTALWTGSQMIIWAGFVGSGNADGAMFNPTTGVWTSMSTANATLSMERPSGVWTGSKMIIWRDPAPMNSGIYNPSTNTWSALNNALSPTGRQYHSTVWTGSKMIVWGGLGLGVNGSTTFNTGGIYTP